jgi:hypothetical protein
MRHNSKIMSFWCQIYGSNRIQGGMRDLTKLTIRGVLRARRVCMKKGSHRKAQVNNEKNKTQFA